MTFTVRPCATEHLGAVQAIEAEAMASLERSDLLRHNSREMLAACLLPPHLTLGAFDAEDRLVGIAILFVPEKGTDDDLSQYLTQYRPTRAANFKLCIVRPRYRGQHLMRVLGQALVEVAKKRGYDGLCSTVSPHNPASYRSLEALDFVLDSTFTHYEGDLERRLYYLP